MDTKKLLDSITTTEMHGLVGFDGFIDELYGLVKERDSEQDYKALKQMGEFADMVQNAVGKSANFEIIQKEVKAGGNGPIMANSLINLGLGLSYGGALGHPDIHPAFQDFSQLCSEVASVCDPARTMALEFNEGKLMLCQLNDLYQINRDKFRHFLSKHVSSAEFFCFLNWTELPNLNGIYELIVELLEAQKEILKRPCFIDLADFKRRSKSDLGYALELIKKMSAYLNIHLGLNWSEAQQLAQHLFADQDFSEHSLSDLAELLQNQLKLQAVCVHSHHQVAACDEKSYTVETLHVAEPKISTGAGDHFNAGYFRAVLEGLGLEQCLQLGVLNSAYYVSTGKTPGLTDLRTFTHH
ncbi:PfkB family carbohydrate kinase [Lentisphaera profundi]|uniref:PfkB family carbohydrate kinase n=1 Tax=Lentisphaera profundi TaxID=1658616 RepID=A0ABY7VUJ9_9BACT|nr:PfkB family carbohydrate kinase [Lentisphaera profundi]WDE95788.1 PfkB family carbohydrate kinase [Lentisphaera profundi]